MGVNRRLIFPSAIRLYKKDWKKVTAHVGTRISAQVRSHAQKVLSDYSTGNKRSSEKNSEGDTSGQASGDECEGSSHANEPSVSQSDQRNLKTEAHLRPISGISADVSSRCSAQLGKRGPSSPLNHTLEQRREGVP